MLRPKDIRENLDNFNSVITDTIERVVTIRGEDDVIPDLEGELAKYATECRLIFLFVSFEGCGHSLLGFFFRLTPSKILPPFLPFGNSKCIF